MRRSLLAAAVAASLALGTGAANSAQLRIGLQEDPDALDPAQGGTFVGRLVFAALCDKLVDIDAKLGFVPQLATEWSWSADNLALTMKLRSGVVFHDGEPMNAEAVKANLDRYREAAYSRRKAEVKSVKSVDVVDAATVRLNLSEPYAPLLSVLADRAGMMMSPKAIAAQGDKIGNNPICSGPYKFERRVAQERIALDKFDGYWNKAAIHIDGIVFLPIPDATVRLANLQSRGVEMIERVAATDVKQIRQNPQLRLADVTSLGYTTWIINVNNGPNANGPLAKNPKVREALELAIDRNVISQVVFEGQSVPSNQAEAPGTTYYNKAHPVPKRDLEKAKALLKESGAGRVGFTITVVNNPSDLQVAQVVQSMANEAGFDVKVSGIETVTLIQEAGKGNFDSAIVLWSGRADPDGNISIWLAGDGFLNWGKYSNPKLDQAFAKARATNNQAARQTLYDEASSIYLADRPAIFLYHNKLIWAFTSKLDGFTPYPDGIIRFQGMKLNP
jgi:peptide/nickel transport system substrate-binding protein